MSLDDQIRDAQDKGLIVFQRPTLFIGKAKHLTRGAIALIFWNNLMNYTRPFKPSRDYCEIVGEYYASAGGITHLLNRDWLKEGK